VHSGLIETEGDPAILAAGLNLRASRGRLGLTMRDVETASARIAERHGNDEFAVSPSRLSDIETKGLVPSIFRLYSLAVIYRRDLATCCRGTGLMSMPRFRM
jgi:transcriptional regulator with XRE-family HTH domain